MYDQGSFFFGILKPAKMNWGKKKAEGRKEKTKRKNHGRGGDQKKSKGTRVLVPVDLLRRLYRREVTGKANMRKKKGGGRARQRARTGKARGIGHFQRGTAAGWKGEKKKELENFGTDGVKKNGAGSRKAYRQGETIPNLYKKKGNAIPKLGGVLQTKGGNR